MKHNYQDFIVQNVSVIIGSALIGLGVRFVMLEKGADQFTANSLNANDLSFSTGNVKDNKLKKYQIIEASQETLEKLLSGKIRKMDELENLEKATNKQDGDVYRKAGNQPYKSSLKYQILLRREYDEKIADDVFIVETIFIKNSL